MTRTHLICASSALALLTFTPLRPASAHAHLRSAQPPVDGTAHADVQDLRITYSEAVEPGFCRVEVTGPDGKAVEAAQPQTDPADAKVLVIHLAHKLAPGAYKVEWHATAVDTHKTDGKYGFTVAP
jgi:methionine-rich copper-binding protein CopC